MRFVSVEELNERLMREFLEEVWNEGNLRFVDDHFAEDFVPHFLPPGIPATREGFKDHIAMWQAAFPGCRTRTRDLMVDEDRVAIRWEFQGTHKGAFLGVPPTGKEVRVTGISAFRLAGGEVVEGWAESDALGLLIQLGVVTPPGAR